MASKNIELPRWVAPTEAGPYFRIAAQRLDAERGQIDERAVRFQPPLTEQHPQQTLRDIRDQAVDRQPLTGQRFRRRTGRLALRPVIPCGQFGIQLEDIGNPGGAVRMTPMAENHLRFGRGIAGIQPQNGRTSRSDAGGCRPADPGADGCLIHGRED